MYVYTEHTGIGNRESGLKVYSHKFVTMKKTYKPLNPCDKCEDVDGVIIPHQHREQYWEHMQCPECKKMWHICTMNCNRWAWGDGDRVMHHFSQVNHTNTFYGSNKSSSIPNRCESFRMHI